MSVNSIKQYFPLFRNQSELVYLDNAATTQKPHSVIEAMCNFYLNSNANAGRGVYKLAVNAEALLEKTRFSFSEYIGCETDQIIFSKNSTEAANLLAFGIGQSRLEFGDNLIVTEIEHHANYLPWQEVAKRHGAELRIWPFDVQTNSLEIDWLDRNLDSKTKVLAISEMSNVTGYKPDLSNIVSKAHQKKAFVIIDGSQSIVHGRPKWNKLEVDAAFFTGHKFYGPMGVGIIYMSKELSKEIPPFLTGGGMIADLPDKWLPPPTKFEAGTLDIAAIVGMNEAIHFLNSMNFDDLLKKEAKLAMQFREMLLSKPGLNILGIKMNEKNVSPIISFEIPGVHPHDLAEILDEENICVRAGHHCAKPLLNRFKKNALTRISLGIYNSSSDVTRLEAGIEKAMKLFL